MVKDDKELLAFYRSQEQRLRAQLKLLTTVMSQEATIINRKLVGGSEVRAAMRAHGISDSVVSQCKFTANAKGIVVEFPRKGGASTGKQRNRDKHAPFTKPTVEERRSASVFARVDEQVAELDKKILDNQR